MSGISVSFENTVSNTAIFPAISEPRMTTGTSPLDNDVIIRVSSVNTATRWFRMVKRVVFPMIHSIVCPSSMPLVNAEMV